jgi:phosphopantothenoylcysteine synthetase/decarboxylase
MRLQNFCVDRRETDWKINDLSLDLIMEHVALYTENIWMKLTLIDPAVPWLPVS